MVCNVSLVLCSTVVSINRVSSVDGKFAAVVQHGEVLHCSEDAFKTNNESISNGLDMSKSNCTSCVLKGADAVFI